MNERIKELAIQAGFFYEDYKDIWYLEYHNQSCEEEMKKFAELIVQQAAAFVSGAAEVYNQAEQDACVRASKGLKKYFGVEE